MPEDPEATTMQQIPQNSITLKKNAKGDYAWDVKVYFHLFKEPEALEKLAWIDEELKKKYGG